jgi:hypothetical protein
LWGETPMRRLFVVLGLAGFLAFATPLLLANPVAHAEVTRGYRKKDGTYVQAYNRSKANGTTIDNYKHGSKSAKKTTRKKSATAKSGSKSKSKTASTKKTSSKKKSS